MLVVTNVLLSSIKLSRINTKVLELSLTAVKLVIVKNCFSATLATNHLYKFMDTNYEKGSICDNKVPSFF